MRKPIFYFLFGFFTALGLVVLLLSPMLLIGLPYLTDKGEFFVKQSETSPDGAYTAIVYGGMGGGAAGWCYVRLGILPKDESFDEKKAAEYSDFVFSVNCSSEVSLQWLEPRKLLVSYTGLKNQSGVSVYESGVSVYMRPRSRDSQVTIEYEAK